MTGSSSKPIEKYSGPRVSMDLIIKISLYSFLHFCQLVDGDFDGGGRCWTACPIVAREVGRREFPRQSHNVGLLTTGG